VKNIIFDIGFVLVVWEPDSVYKIYFNNDEDALHLLLSKPDMIFLVAFVILLFRVR